MYAQGGYSSPVVSLMTFPSSLSDGAVAAVIFVVLLIGVLIAVTTVVVALK